MDDLALGEHEKRYLIFEREWHSVVQMIRADTTTQALWDYIAEQNRDAVLQADGSVIDGDIHFPHPLAYIEARYKTEGEWQIRELPDWAWEDNFAEVFCGESADGGPSVISDCRKHFAREFPKIRARAFLWYLKNGTLVTFYRRRGTEINLLKRYLWNWDGHQLTVEEWHGSYDEIADALLLLPSRWSSPRRRQS